MKEQEKALIVHPILPLKVEKGTTRYHRELDDLVAEVEGLVHAIHMQVSSTRIAKVTRISPAQLLGKGAAETVGLAIEEEKPAVVVVNYKLSPVQQRNLETLWNVKVIDRTGLILEIFGERAQTKEGRIQVDLAMLEYQKSRLVRSWTHLERQRGGGGFMGGPGETQIELDRRAITDRIVQLKRDLEQVRRTRDLGRKQREKTPFPIVALVGYTNAGKSTLFNRLTGANVFAENLVFATLDPTLRRLELPNGKTAIFSDTVGFIADLPTTLVEAFRATLDQVRFADIILHVRDVSSHDHPWQRQDVINVLTELDINYEHDPRIFEVLNKTDLIEEELLRDVTRDAAFSDERLFPVSAKNGEGIDTLLQKVGAVLSQADAVYSYEIPHKDGKALAWLHEQGEVIEQDNDAGDTTHVKVRLSTDDQGRFESKFSMLMMFDHEKVSEIIRAVAADKIVPRFRQLTQDEIKTKSGPNDLVTIADEEAEIELTRLLPMILPGSLVLGEEAVSGGRVLRDVLARDDFPVWVVDPVDGTNNFAHGRDVFGTMVALVHRGERIASWIYQIPIGRMISAEQGGGVFMDALKCQPAAQPSAEANFSNIRAFISRKFMPPEIRPYVEAKIALLQDAKTYMCCAWEYVELLEGKAAFSIYKRIEPWDHLAGALILEEAGFYVRKWDGTIYGGSDLEGGLINAPSEGLWRRVYETFLKEPLASVRNA